MNILIIADDDMIRRNLPLAFKKYFSEAKIYTAFNLKSVQNTIQKENIFDIVLIDSELKDIVSVLHI